MLSLAPTIALARTDCWDIAKDAVHRKVCIEQNRLLVFYERSNAISMVIPADRINRLDAQGQVESKSITESQQLLRILSGERDITVRLPRRDLFLKRLLPIMVKQ